MTVRRLDVGIHLMRVPVRRASRPARGLEEVNVSQKTSAEDAGGVL